MLNKENVRLEDNNREILITEVLKENIFPELERLGIAECITVITDVEQQKKGVDVKFDDTPVDIKTRWSMTNRICNSLALELATTLETGQRIDGWYLDNANKLTEYYLFVHIVNAGDGRIGKEGVTKENIKGLKFNLIKVSELNDYLAENGITLEKLKELKNEAEKLYDETKQRQLQAGPFDWAKKKTCFSYFQNKEKTYYKCYISVSKNKGMPENPTNLVIDEDVVNAFPSSKAFYWFAGKGITFVE